MATRVQKAKVLVFLVVCLGVMAGGLALIRGYTHGDVAYYSIDFSESVLGLYAGAYVVYQGVPVGKVKDIAVGEDGRAHVVIEVEVRKVKLREGVKAQLVLYSIASGSLAVNLFGGEPDAPELPPGSSIESELSFLGAAGEQTSTLLSNLSNVAESLRTSLDGMEKGDLARLIKRTDELVEETRKTVVSMRDTTEHLAERVESGVDVFGQLAEDLKATSEKTRELIAGLQTKLDAIDAERMNDGLIGAIEKGDALLERLYAATDSLDSAAGLILHDAQNVEYKFRETLNTVNEAVEALRDLIEYLKEDPSALVRGKGRTIGGR